jgi:hypothetical protein
MYDNIPQAESNRVLCCVMLNDAFEAKGLEVPLAAAAVEKLLAARLSMNLDLGVKDPLHVFQRQLLGERPFSGVNGRCFTGCPRGSGVLFYFGVKMFSNV